MRGRAALVPVLLSACAAGCCYVPDRPLSEDPLSAREHILLGDIYRRDGDRDSAVAEYRRALAEAPDDAGAHRRLGEIALEKGSLRDAAGHFEAVLRIDPQDVRARNNLAWTLLMRRRDLPRAEDLAAGAAREAPAPLRPHCLRTCAQVRAARADWAGAVEAGGESLSLWAEPPPPAEFVLEVAEWRLRAGDAAGAADAARGVLAGAAAGSPDGERARRLLERAEGR